MINKSPHRFGGLAGFILQAEMAFIKVHIGEALGIQVLPGLLKDFSAHHHHMWPLARVLLPQLELLGAGHWPVVQHIEMQAVAFDLLIVVGELAEQRRGHHLHGANPEVGVVNGEQLQHQGLASTRLKEQPTARVSKCVVQAGQLMGHGLKGQLDRLETLRQVVAVAKGAQHLAKRHLWSEAKLTQHGTLSLVVWLRLTRYTSCLLSRLLGPRFLPEPSVEPSPSTPRRGLFFCLVTAQTSSCATTAGVASDRGGK